MRDAADVVLAGIGTVQADDPQLNTRLPKGGRDALRVVVDSEARMAPGARMLTQGSAAATLVFVSEKAPAERRAALRAAGAEVVEAPLCEGRVDLAHVLGVLGARGVCTVLAETGPRMSTALLAQGLVDKVVAFVAPKLIGGDGSNVLVNDLGRPSIGQALSLVRPTWRAVGDDLMLHAYLEKSAQHV